MRRLLPFLLIVPALAAMPTVAADDTECEDDDGWRVDWIPGIFLASDSSVELTSVIIYLVPDVTSSQTFTFFANALCLIPLVDMECLANQAAAANASPRDCTKL